MGKKLKNRVVKTLALFLMAMSWGGASHAEVTPANMEPEKAEGRVPASYSEKYEKKTEGLFEAQGFGEDIPEPKKLREPASEKDKAKPFKEAKPKKTSSVDQKTDPADLVTVKQEKELANELQLQRRVEVFYEGRVRLKNGAAIWATEDAGMTSPKMEVSASEQADLKSESIKFRVFSNYAPFIDRWELRVFRRSSSKSEQDLEILSGDRSSLYNIEFKFEEKDFKLGDSIYYQLKVFNSEGLFDTVKTKKITFVERVENQNLTDQDGQAETDLIDQIWGQSSLEIQNIPIRGSRVRIVGNNLPRDHFVSYRGQSIRVDEVGKFLIEEHFPVGKHKILVDLQDKTKKENFSIPFNIDVSGKYFFMVGIADLRIGENELSEKVAVVDDNGDYDNGVFVDGRLAYFLKGKIQGKYLITSQLDTTEGDIKEIFQGLHRKNSESLFRRLDPDRYYPVYGDNSKTTEEAPTLGKFYVKIEVDQSYAMWGNANTDLSGTLFSQYNRTLYGGHVNFQSTNQTKYGDQKTKVTAFLAEPETLFGHNEFLGTGSRLYILRHNDVVQGSEKIVLEVRDRDSNIMEKQIVLKPFIDYEFDYLAGRIVLTRPITSFVLDSSDQIIDQNPNANDTYHLVVDYEYNDTGDALDNVTYGGRAQKWFGDHVAIGGTYVEEKRDDATYNLSGLDATFRMGAESFVKVESSKTKNVQTGSNFVSQDGGLSFITKPIAVNPNNESAEAWGVETQFFLNDFVDTTAEAVISSWYRDYEAGFSTARRQTQNDLKEYGFDTELKFTRRDVVKSKMTFAEEVGGSKRKTLVASYGRKLGSASTLSTEYRVDTDERANQAVIEGKLVGLKWNQRLSKSVSAYIKGQKTVSEEGGYLANDRYAIGSKFRIGKKWEGTAEFSDGDRGEGALAGLGYNVSQGHQVYANLSNSVDSTSGPVATGITLGQRKSFKNGVRLTTENQFEETGNNTGVNQLYGVDYNLSQVLNTSFSYQIGELTNGDTGAITDKSAISAGLTYTKNTAVTASTKASVVKNTGDVPLDQFLITNALKFKLGPSRTLFFEFDYSITEDPTGASEPAAKYTEANVGYAFRPVMNDRWNLFARYTYLYDLDSRAQENARNDQRVNIFSVEATYDLSRRWEIGGRVAQKIGSERLVRGTGPWLDTTLLFTQMRARYHIIKKWDMLFEYRAVEVKEASDIQTGALVGIDYHLGSNFKVGVGYNFTRFNDDLTNFSFDDRGWFLNVVGKL
jgi:hypothetical protein